MTRPSGCRSVHHPVVVVEERGQVCHSHAAGGRVRVVGGPPLQPIADLRQPRARRHRPDEPDQQRVEQARQHAPSPVRIGRRWEEAPAQPCGQGRRSLVQANPSHQRSVLGCRLGSGYQPGGGCRPWGTSFTAPACHVGAHSPCGVPPAAASARVVRAHSFHQRLPPTPRRHPGGRPAGSLTPTPRRRARRATPVWAEDATRARRPGPDQHLVLRVAGCESGSAGRAPLWASVTFLLTR